MQLIAGDLFDYVLLLILGFFPLLYKLFFWLYTIQLKEYRWDRFKEYLRTKQGKSALFNIFSILEFFLFLASISIYLIYNFGNQKIGTYLFGSFWSVLFVYLILLNIFVFGKIFRKKILKPKLTSRIIILLLFFSLGGIFDIYALFKWNLWNFTYFYILGTYIFMPIILFFYNFISLPIVNYKKNKIIKSAIKKSEITLKPIKIAITGSYGKSSVKEFLSSILEQTGEKILKTPENINTELGVSAVVLKKLNDACKYFVAEIGAYRIGEIRVLGKIVNHKYGFLTAIGNQHIGLFGNQENIVKAKFEILEKIKENKGFLYVNGDNKYIVEFLKNNDIDNVIKYGIQGENLDARSKILSIENKENNFITKFEFSYIPKNKIFLGEEKQKEEIKEIFETNLIGEHNILNITGVLAFCYDIGLKTEDLKTYLLDIKKPKNTGEIFYKKNDNSELVLIDDTYNLSEASLESGLSLLKYFDKKYKKILVLDDILELGDEAKKIHFELAKKIVKEKSIDKIFYVGINYKKDFENGLLEGGFEKKNILNNLKENIGNSVILFEGRGAGKILEKLKKK